MKELTDRNSIRAEACPHCILCGNTGVFVHRDLPDRLFGAPGFWNLKKCSTPDCGLLWPDPMPLTEDLGKAYANYYTHSPQRGCGQSGPLHRLYHLVKRGYLAGQYGYPPGSSPVTARCVGLALYFLPVLRVGVDNGIRFLHATPRGRVLDVGCGDGEWLLTMRDLGWRVQGVDFDPNAVNAAQQLGLDVRCGNLAEQNYASNSFDAVTLNHVIEHVPDPTGLLKECLRVLKPQGQLFLATPNSDSFGHRLFKEYWRGLEPPRHLHVLSPPAMQRLLACAGFAPVFVRTYSAHYVWHHSYRLWLGSKNLNGVGITALARFVPHLLNSFEQALLLCRPTWGECISAVARKP